jgi:hypothetical protein
MEIYKKAMATAALRKGFKGREVIANSSQPIA